MIEQTNKQTDKQRLQLYVYYRCEMIKYYSFYLSIQKAMGANISLQYQHFLKPRRRKFPYRLKFWLLVSRLNWFISHYWVLRVSKFQRPDHVLSWWRNLDIFRIYPTNKNPWRTQDYLVYFTRETCEYPVIIHVLTRWMSTIWSRV